MQNVKFSLRRACQIWFMAMVIMGSMVAQGFAGSNDPLFVNLTSDDLQRASMAITFGKNQLERGHALTIFLNDRGVFVGSKTQAAKFAAQHKALSEIIGKGATVIVCPMCMQHYGLKESDLIPGLKVGNPKLLDETLFKDDTKTLTW
jgi:sulfur relay (sulfurtransferase) complex TusBCD TusD component (DsrE family)